MSESNQSPQKPLLLITLVLLLFVVVCVQAWHMIGMEKQLAAIKVEQTPTQPPVHESAAQVTESSEPDTIEVAATIDQSSSTLEEQSADYPQTNADAPAKPPNLAQALDPYEEFLRMRRQIGREFGRGSNDRYHRTSRRPDYEHHFSRRISSPKIDVREDGNQYMVSVAIPGTDEDNISVNLQGRRLTIKAKQGYEKENSDPSGRFVFRERQSSNFRRSVILREPVDAGGMETHVDNGILMVTIPKARW